MNQRKGVMKELEVVAEGSGDMLGSSLRFLCKLQGQQIFFS